MLEKPLGVPIVGIYTSCMKLRKLSIGQKKHLATTARICSYPFPPSGQRMDLPDFGKLPSFYES